MVLALLTGALGVHDPSDSDQALDPKDLARHGPLLVAHVMTGAPRPLADYLTTAFAEIRRGEDYD